jgi:hypothetical protein
VTNANQSARSPDPDSDAFHGTVSAIVRSRNYSQDELTALGLMWFLDSYDFEVGALRTVQNYTSQSRAELTLFISNLFPELGHNVDWWRAKALDNRYTWSEMEKIRAWWHARFAEVQNLTFVK